MCVAVSRLEKVIAAEAVVRSRALGDSEDSISGIEKVGAGPTTAGGRP